MAHFLKNSIYRAVIVAVIRAVASSTRGPGFESSDW